MSLVDRLTSIAHCEVGVATLTSDDAHEILDLIASADHSQSVLNTALDTVARLQRDLDFARDIARLVDSGREESTGGVARESSDVVDGSGAKP